MSKRYATVSADMPAEKRRVLEDLVIDLGLDDGDGPYPFANGAGSAPVQTGGGHPNLSAEQTWYRSPAGHPGPAPGSAPGVQLGGTSGHPGPAPGSAPGVKLGGTSGQPGPSPAVVHSGSAPGVQLGGTSGSAPAVHTGSAPSSVPLEVMYRDFPLTKNAGKAIRVGIDITDWTPYISLTAC